MQLLSVDHFPSDRAHTTDERLASSGGSQVNHEVRIAQICADDADALLKVLHKKESRFARSWPA